MSFVFSAALYANDCAVCLLVFGHCVWHDSGKCHLCGCVWCWRAHMHCPMTRCYIAWTSHLWIAHSSRLSGHLGNFQLGDLMESAVITFVLLLTYGHLSWAYNWSINAKAWGTKISSLTRCWKCFSRVILHIYTPNSITQFYMPHMFPTFSLWQSFNIFNHV